jgi:hypothetical protein
MRQEMKNKMKSVLEHVKKQIDESAVSEEIDGYPYIQILNFFPQHYYEELVEVFKGMNNKGFYPLSKNYQDRYVYQISRGENVHSPMPTFNDLTERERNFWKDFQDTFYTSGFLKTAFLEKYDDYIDFPKEYYGHMMDQCRLQRDYKGYSIGAHRDKLDKILSVMIYTPTTDDPRILEDHGTALLTPKFEDPEKVPHHPDHVGQGKDRHFRFEEMNLVKTASSIPNSIYSWAVAEKSYHGVTPLESDHTRHTMAFFVKIPKQLMQFHKLYGAPDFKC